VDFFYIVVDAAGDGFMEVIVTISFCCWCVSLKQCVTTFKTLTKGKTGENKKNLLIT